MSQARSAARGAAVTFLFGGLLIAVARPPVLAQGNAAAAEKRAPAAVAPGDLAILGRDGAVAGQCPLKHTSVNADVSGFVSRVTVKQEFTNPSKTPIEAVYTFPLPADAAVDDMKMTLGDRTISAQIKRKEEARKIYETARANGQAAALLDQERPNIFTQSVANIMPGQNVTITLSYSNLLKYDDGSYEFTFPMVVGPRNVAQQSYDGAPGNSPVLVDPGNITPPITAQGTRAGHDISLSVNLDAGLPLQEVKSQLHEVTVVKDGPNRAKISLRDEKSIPNKDFILRYTVGGDQVQTGVLAHSDGNGTGYFTLILQPPAAPAPKDIAPKEMVFVIDQTGSQRGEPIKKAKETMKYCLENLNPGDTFQLIGFNTQIFPCFEAPVPLTEESMKRALAFLEPIEGNGGTDILKSVDYALKIPADPKRLRMVCYMTDGYVGNDMQVLDYVRKNRGQARMFVFGVGNSVNRFLIDGMAREGRGASEIVDLKMPGEKAASRFYARIHKPILLDPQVAFNGLTVEDVYPKAIPDVFSSGPIILKGRYKGAPQGDVTVSGILRGQAWSQKVHVAFPALRKEGEALPTLWAREKLEDLQSQDWLGAQSGNPDPKIKDQIVNLALDFRLMSQYTSFVAVEDRVVNVGGKQRRVDIPVEMPEGVSYEGIFGAELDGLEVRELARNQGAVRKEAEVAEKYSRRRMSVAAPKAEELRQQVRQGQQPQSLGFMYRYAAPAPAPVVAGSLSRAYSAKDYVNNPTSGRFGRGLGTAPMGGGLGGGVGGGGFGSSVQSRGAVPANKPAGASLPKVTGAVNLGSHAAQPSSPAPLSTKPASLAKAKTDADKRIDRAAAAASGGPAAPTGVVGPTGPRAPQSAPVAAGTTTLYSVDALKRQAESKKEDRPVREAQAAKAPVKTEVFYKQLSDLAPADRGVFFEDLQRNPEQTLARLPLKPAERKRIIRTMKLSAPLLALVPNGGKPLPGAPASTAKPEVVKGRVLVQIWASQLTPTQLRSLQTLGFLPAAELKPKELVLGSIPVAKLAGLADLPFVAYVDVPKFVN